MLFSHDISMDASSVRLNELNNQLHTLEDTRDLPQKQLAEGNAQIHPLQYEKASLGPLLTLPDEVLIMILDEACLHNFPRCGVNDMEAPYQSLVLSHISHRWRNLALSLPRIWTCIHISSSSDKSPRVLDIYLANSQAHPLSVSVACKDNYDGTINWKYWHHTTKWKAFWNSWIRLCAIAQRWRHCSITCDATDVMEMLQDSISHSTLTQLQYLQLHCDENYEDFAIAANMGWASPCLTHLRLRLVIAPLETALLGNIVELSLHKQDLDPNFLLRLSLIIPRLAMLDLSDITFDANDGHAENAYFPYLRRLILASIPINPILSVLEAPSLTTLWVRFPNDGHNPAVSFQQYPRLTELRCDSCQLSHIRPLMSETVTTLCLSSHNVGEYLEALMPGTGSISLPLLHTVASGWTFPFSDSSVLKFARAKSQTSCPLRVIRIMEPAKHIEDDIVNALRSLQVVVEPMHDLWETKYTFSLIPRAE